MSDENTAFIYRLADAIDRYEGEIARAAGIPFETITPSLRQKRREVLLECLRVAIDNGATLAELVLLKLVAGFAQADPVDYAQKLADWMGIDTDMPLKLIERVDATHQIVFLPRAA